MYANTHLNIGIIGFGFIGKLHANAYHNIPYCFQKPTVQARIQAVLRSRPKEDLDFIQTLGIEKVTSNHQEFYQMPIDVVDICTPNFLHLEQVIEALNHKKHVYCEKPLGKNLSEARAMVDAAKKSNLLTHTALMMRYVPAVCQMKALIDNGEIGEPYHFRAHLYHSSYLDAQRPMAWRLRKANSGGGALADLGIHALDLLLFMLDNIDWVQCVTRTYIQQRPSEPGSKKMETVDVDDWAVCTLGTKNGASGLLEVSRVSGGNSESIAIEIIGSRGTVKVDFEDPLTCYFFNTKRKQWLIGPHDFPPPAGMRSIEQLWPPAKQTLGYMLNAHLASAYDFMQCVQKGKSSMVSFSTALAAQELLEAAYISADRNGVRINLPID